MKEKQTPEQAAEEYFTSHQFMCDVVVGPDRIDVPLGEKFLALPDPEYPKQIRRAFLAGRSHFIEHELRTVLSEAYCYGADAATDSHSLSWDDAKAFADGVIDQLKKEPRT